MSAQKSISEIVYKENMNAPGIPVHVQKNHLFYYQSIILGKM